MYRFALPASDHVILRGGALLISAFGGPVAVYGRTSILAEAQGTQCDRIEHTLPRVSRLQALRKKLEESRATESMPTNGLDWPLPFAIRQAAMDWRDAATATL